MKSAMTMAALGVAILGACTRPGEDRAVAELEVGKAELADARVEVTGGLAAVRELADHRLVLWANAPALEIGLDLGNAAGGEWTITVMNTLSDAELSVDGAVPVARTVRDADGPTTGTFVVTLSSDMHVLRLASPDAAEPGPFRVAAMADIQTALESVDDVFRAISATPDLRFVVAMGDITQRAQTEEYELFERQLTYLTVPYYTTLGNHELWEDHHRYFDRFGRASFQFLFKDVAFTFADSGDAAIDPLVDEWLQGWFRQAHDKTHVFLTHMPPIDPVGVRYGSFRSTRDGQRLLADLSDGMVDLTLYGHIHTFLDYENAGIPAYISGGGGAQPMKGDGIDRHFLVVSFDATQTDSVTLYGGRQSKPGGVRAVELHRVDEP